MKKRTFFNRSRDILTKAFNQREELIRKGKSKNPAWTLDTVVVLKNFMLIRETDEGMYNYCVKYGYDIIQLPKPLSKLYYQIIDLMGEAGDWKFNNE